MQNSTKFENPDAIDAVITWVDGQDPKHSEKLNRYLTSIGRRPPSAHSTRFNEAGEFIYCIASILRFAPWIRKIFIVTDEQTPDFMSLIEKSSFANRVLIIDHKVIFKGYESNLPTFNSLSIESLLWRIPDLSERYIYLNDDYLFIRPVKAESFFIDNKIVVRGKWETQQSERWYNSLYHLVKKEKNRVKNRIAQALSAKITGYSKKYFRVPHNPHPQFKSLQSDFFSNNEDLLTSNIKYPLRSEEQYVPTALTNHLAFKNKRAIIDNRYKTIRLKLNKLTYRHLKIKLFFADRDKNTAFTCLQSLDMANDKVKQETLHWLERRIGSLESVMGEISNNY
ncbi:stealth family protein [Alkalitalea saponilacus]|uniref:Stealth protein CR1, conserved region 1 n=1 Tax=Alkalitalea saponilacus TaxID=889453 RepID=A0A1T5EDR0_9BACT|nr:stealth family protein [Alkalitalea saponilacus]ASB51097.1 capsular biosynthesis protein [Alkalitalea saponilacus]SKB82053.1 Stealth protein CR1, conserved region 1 [Alkalitalea saponilacus]